MPERAVILITGIQAAGKSTVAQLLARAAAAVGAPARRRVPEDDRQRPGGHDPGLPRPRRSASCGCGTSDRRGGFGELPLRGRPHGRRAGRDPGRASGRLVAAIRSPGRCSSWCSPRSPVRSAAREAARATDRLGRLTVAQLDEALRRETPPHRALARHQPAGPGRDRGRDPGPGLDRCPRELNESLPPGGRVVVGRPSARCGCARARRPGVPHPPRAPPSRPEPAAAPHHPSHPPLLELLPRCSRAA